MDSSFVLRVMLVAAGFMVLGMISYSLARRKMTEPFVLTWGLISLILILEGLLLRPSGLRRYVSNMTMVMLCAAGFLLILMALFVSVKISELTRMNLELSMQVSLLKQELGETRKQIREQLNLPGKEKLSEEDNGVMEVGDERAFGGDQYAGTRRSGDGTAGAAASPGSFYL